MGRGHFKLPWGCCTAYLGAGITQWEVTEQRDEMVPTTNRASDLFDGVDDIKRPRTKFREITTLGILQSILNKSVRGVGWLR
jgi:hypothetical protein